MAIEYLRELQRNALTKAERRKLWLELSKDMSMQSDNFHRLEALHGKYCHGSVATLPDGWAKIVGHFLGDLDDIGDLVDAVSVRFEHCADGARAFVFPEMTNWTPRQLSDLRVAQRVLLLTSRETCQRCGKSNAVPVSVGEHSFFLCQEHQTTVQAKLDAKADAMEDRAQFRELVGDILPPTTALLLPMTDYNTRIMRKALLDIKAIVEAQGLVGHVIATKVIESDGQLFMNVRCGHVVDPATQFEVADIVKHAEWQSDQAHLQSGKENGNDA